VLATEQQSPESRLAALRQEADVLARQPEGTLELLSLRALQAELFLLAVAGWNTSQPAPNEVLELGGPFAGFAAISWADGQGGLVVSRDQLRLFYRVYWGRLTGLSADAAFEPSVDEARRYYRTVLVHPPDTSADQMSQDLARLNYVQALGEVDSSYPSLLAQALLSLRLGQPEKAHRLLTLHLGQHPEGSWTAIARNARLFAAQAIPPGAP
jgi:hypothetical protein